MSGGPFTGIRVLELAGIGPAQHAGMLLADLGAEVIRVDRPGAVPPASTGSSRELLARGRRSIALDLTCAAGVDLGLALIERSDVLLDPFRPGVTERLGIGPEVATERAPELVYARMTGWGQTGPLARAAAHDINYIALAGALHAIGEPDSPPPVPLNLVGDFGGGGMLLGFAVATALFERSRSGRGQVVDVAMIDGVASLMTSIFQLEAMGEWVDGRGAKWLQGAAPWYRAYETADGRYLTVGALEPQFYARLLERLGLDPATWPQWDRGNWLALTTRLTQIFLSRPLADWSAELEGSDVCFAPALRLDELGKHPHLAARDVYVERDGVMQPAPVPRFERTPGKLTTPPPWPGQNSLEVLAELGVDESRRAMLLQDETVVQRAEGA